MASVSKLSCSLPNPILSKGNRSSICSSDCIVSFQWNKKNFFLRTSFRQQFLSVAKVNEKTTELNLREESLSFMRRGLAFSMADLQSGGGKKTEEIAVGSAIVIVEAPPYVKTAEPMPMMRTNDGIINEGDAGRILDRRPKNVWAIRFASGAYLVDRKYFNLLET